jgi:GNAT superfamily N-acetyltransferase
MKPGMRYHSIFDAQGHTKDVASCMVSYSRLDVPGVERLRDLTKIYVEPEHRKKGYAKALLLQLCLEADKHGVLLMLQPKPYADGSWTADELAALYHRFSFCSIQGVPPIMVRQCKGKPHATSKP